MALTAKLLRTSYQKNTKLAYHLLEMDFILGEFLGEEVPVLTQRVQANLGRTFTPHLIPFRHDFTFIIPLFFIPGGDLR